MGMQPFPFESLFEEDELGRRLIFQSLLPQNLSASDQRTAGNLFIPTFNQFLGQVGRDIRGGQTPTTFANFVSNDFNLTRGLAQQGNTTTPGLTSRTTQFGF